jgi:hypothetical protein
MKRLTGSLYQCGRCQEHFAGPRALARHYQSSDGAALECLPPELMQAIGMRLTRHEFWVLDAPRPVALSTQAEVSP